MSGNAEEIWGSSSSGGPLRYAFGPGAFFAPKFRGFSVLLVPLCCATELLVAKTAQKPLKSAVVQCSGRFFAAHTRIVSGVMAEFRYATLKANRNSAVLRYS
jgi:hypothetical protein